MKPNERIARLRALAHVTQYQLSALTGINAAYICMFENNLRPLSGDQIAEVERVLVETIESKAEEARKLARTGRSETKQQAVV